MAMSKRKFGFLLLFLIVVLGGGVAIVIIFKNKNAATDSKTANGPMDDLGRQSSPAARKGVTGSRGKCQTWLRNPTTPWEYAGRFTFSRIATRESISGRSGEKITRNSYWLTGDSDLDAEALNGIRLQACMGKIPVVVIRMRPNIGLTLSNQHSNWDFYKPKSVVESWTQYDEILKTYFRDLNGVPAMIILEPDLLMFTYDVKNNQHRWSNTKYEEEFLKRANRLISLPWITIAQLFLTFLRVMNPASVIRTNGEAFYIVCDLTFAKLLRFGRIQVKNHVNQFLTCRRLPNARVYVDAGNAGYLSMSASTLDQMAKTLLRLPGLRGFSINAMHFVNQTYNEFVARQLYCRTGYHYVVDTSRNGGSFSKQPLPKTEKCLFDPPNMKTGQFPGWAWGSQKEISAPRLKRWINQIGSSADDFKSRSNFQQRTTTARSTTKETPNPADRNDPNWAVKQYNALVNSRRNNVDKKPGQHSNNRPNNNNNINNNNHQTNQGNNFNYNRNPRPDQNKGSNPRRQYSTESPSVDQNSNNKDTQPGGVRSLEVADQYFQSFKSSMRSCMSRKSNTIAHDANIWIKTPGEADGRLYRFGVFRKCLIDHTVPCDDSCRLFVQTESNRETSCQCSIKLTDTIRDTPVGSFHPDD